MKLFFGEIFPRAVLHPDEEQHIVKVLRMKDGDEIFLTDGKGNLISSVIILQGKKVHLEQVKIMDVQPDISHKIHIAIAPTKNIDRIEFFVEKAVELGVSEISFILTEHSERKNINFEKIQKQIIAASKQCIRTHFPKLNDIVKLKDFVSRKDLGDTFVAHCDQNFFREDLQKGNFASNTTFLIGPEGDFSPNEIKMLLDEKIKAISLGPRRLRTETAGVFLAAWNYQRSVWENI